MADSILITAFLMGLVSASSLPLGAMTALLCHPSDRLIAVLMAFGGGALLAALTIDLVASAVQEGHFHALAIGAILGGLSFIGLNQVINDYGGFLLRNDLGRIRFRWTDVPQYSTSERDILLHRHGTRRNRRPPYRSDRGSRGSREPYLSYPA